MADASKTSFDAFGKTVSIENDLHLRIGRQLPFGAMVLFVWPPKFAKTK